MLLAFGVTNAQTVEGYIDGNGFVYTQEKGDPFKTRIYTLKNGLTVYLSDYKATPRVQTYIAVKAGSKNDPAEYTGLAHYLEHIMFKGTSKIGTQNWKKEKPLLNKIEKLYNEYGQLTDSAARKAKYHEIDSVSGEASKYAIANEYDKLLSNIGAQGTNAYTWVEQTVYVNDIPSNEVEKWTQIEAERFSEVVPRLFHTELEAVYEEKNRTLDNDRRKAWTAMMSGLFPKHQYGTQTTIGTVDDLKNPSITEIKKYFDNYYRPNNVAICMSGDLDLDQTIKWISDSFGKWEKAYIPKYKAPKESKLKYTETEVLGPDAEGVTIGFRFPGASDKESLMMELVSMVLSNSQAGLIDLNLNQAQKLQGGYSYPMRMKDYSAHLLGARPKQDQSLEEVKGLLLGELERIKKGDFADWLLPAIINDYKLSQTIESERNKSRADHYVSSFVLDMPWKEYINETKVLEKITKKELVKFVNKCYKDNMVVVYKRTGKVENAKVDKPTITPVSVNREDHSAFFQKVFEKETTELSPAFLDYDKDITKSTINGLELLYKKNVENDLFQLYYVLNVGSLHDKKLSLAVNYLSFLGTDKYTAEQLQQEFYKLGCNYGVHTSEDQVYVSLSGLNENFDKAVTLFESIFKNVKPNQEAYDNLVSDILKGRDNAKLSKQSILSSAMVSYAKYGKDSPFMNRLSADELKAIQPSELVGKINTLFNYEHRVLYYGASDVATLKKALESKHKVPASFLKTPEAKEYTELPIVKPTVLFVEYDMVQAEVLMLSQSVKYNQELLPKITLFNEYFGGNMGSIVFQELRESKALAYSVKSYYKSTNRLNKHNYIVSYIGTQADKIHDAIGGMRELLDSLPQSVPTFDNALQSLLRSYQSSRVIKSSVLFNYLNAEKMGHKSDIRKDAYDFLKDATLEDVNAFYKQYYRNQPYTMLVIGSKENVDLESLKQYGEVKELTLEEVFGY